MWKPNHGVELSLPVSTVVPAAQAGRGGGVGGPYHLRSLLCPKRERTDAPDTVPGFQERFIVVGAPSVQSVSDKIKRLGAPQSHRPWREHMAAARVQAFTPRLLHDLHSEQQLGETF